MEIPYVSVIVPMYNAEKYIGELLDSLLEQTLKNFEVIIVDDCSTDNSCAVAESYKPKFEGRLTLMRLQDNSGGPSTPRNKGLEMSRGKYILFADADDAFISATLEELYNLAEQFNVDVVHCEKYFTSSGVGEDFQKNKKVVIDNTATSGTVNLMSENVVDRINTWLQFKFGVMPWRSLVSRKLLIDSDIKFPDIRREDVFWAFEVLFSAKKILRTPTPYCIHRVDHGSLTTKNQTLEKYLSHWLDRTVNGLKLLEDFMLKIPFFVQNPAARYTILNHWAMGDLELISRVCANFEPYVLKETFQKAFSKDLGDKGALIAFLFANSVSLIKELSATKKID